MLRQLIITNYALIDQVEINLENGFTTITGETGSGKSILIGALGLILGDRADLKSIRDNASKCVVEAIFSNSSAGIIQFLTDNDLDIENEITLRREIAGGGKSRCFINDTPVQLALLKELGSRLVDIHSQHENSILGNREFQFEIVDAFASNNKLLQLYREQYSNWKSIGSDLDALITGEAQLRKDLDYFTFQFEELSKAGLDSFDQKNAEQELETLTHAEQIRAGLSQVNDLLEGETGSVAAQLNNAKSVLSKITSFHTKLEEIHNRIESVRIEISDIQYEASLLSEKINPDAKRINDLNEQLSKLYHLQKKHGLKEISELISLRESLSEKISLAENLDEKIILTRKKLADAESDLSKHANDLTTSRARAAKEVERSTRSYFKKLGLEHAMLEIVISDSPIYSVHGKNEISMKFSANKGVAMQLIKSVASGGEISRVMLALKAAISECRSLPTLILDEIDQGISGETAKKTGVVMKEMSAKVQLLSITHLPQIAGKADHHFKVYKTSGRNETVTKIQQLSEVDRINELAEMLSGKKFSEAAVENARELLK